jgi:hypothetical protein
MKRIDDHNLALEVVPVFVDRESCLPLPATTMCGPRRSGPDAVVGKSRNRVPRRGQRRSCRFPPGGLPKALAHPIDQGEQFRW